MQEIIRNRPVAKFFYKGNHSHAVKRTVLITELDRNTLKGYEVRSGNEVRDLEDAPVKTFRKDKIATTDQLRSDSTMHSNKGESTLERFSISQMSEVGV